MGDHNKGIFMYNNDGRMVTVTADWYLSMLSDFVLLLSDKFYKHF